MVIEASSEIKDDPNSDTDDSKSDDSKDVKVKTEPGEAADDKIKKEEDDKDKVGTDQLIL